MVKQKLRGSFTVEAALLLPMILFILFSMVCLSFYLHDRSRMEGILDEVLHKGAITAKHEADMRTGKVEYENIGNRGVFYLLTGDTEQQEKELEDYLQEILEQGFFLTEITDIQVEVNRLTIRIALEGEFEVPMKGILEFFHPDRKITVEAERWIHDPSEFIRISEVVLDTGSRIKGFEELKGRIDKILGR